MFALRLARQTQFMRMLPQHGLMRGISTIPYDPRLSLGSLVDEHRMQRIVDIANIEKPVDDAHATLSDAIRLKRELDFTLQDLKSMGVPEDGQKDIVAKIGLAQKDVVAKAGDYATKKMAAEDQIIALRSGKGKGGGGAAGDAGDKDEGLVTTQSESLVDFESSQIKTLPLAADSMNMQVKFIRNESEEDGSSSHADAVAAYVNSTETLFFGTEKNTHSAAGSVKNALVSTNELHPVEGTLIISCMCTHKNSQVFAPCTIDLTKAIKAWNTKFPSDLIEPLHDKPQSDQMSSSSKDNKMDVIVGQTVGSSFIGMVHILKVESTETSQSTMAIASRIQASAEEDLWIESVKGSFGVSADFSENMKHLTSKSNVLNSAGVTTRGVVASIKSNVMETSIKALRPDAKEVMDQQAAILAAADGDVDGNAAKTGSGFMSLNNAYLKQAFSSAVESDKQQNKVIDTNSLMTSFEHYLDTVRSGSSGLPLSYQLRSYEKGELLDMLAKRTREENDARRKKHLEGDDGDKDTKKPNE